MKRRDVIQAGAAAALAAAAPLRSVFAQQKTVWKAADVHPLGYPTVEAVVRMGKKIETATSGRISLQMYPLMQLGGEKEMIEQAQLGALQLARISVGPMGPVVDELNVYSLTGHLIIPEILVFSKRTWDTLSQADQDLLRKVAREAQTEERGLWDKMVAESTQKLKAAGMQFVETDKKAFYDATRPIREKYGSKHVALIKRIEDTK